MKMIWAVIRWDKVKPIAQALKGMGVSGCSVSRVRGYGEEWHLYEPLIHGGHHKLEVIVEDNQVEKVPKEIAALAFTGVKGDGIVSVIDVGHVVKIRLENAKRA